MHGMAVTIVQQKIPGWRDAAICSLQFLPERLEDLRNSTPTQGGLHGYDRAFAPPLPDYRLSGL